MFTDQEQLQLDDLVKAEPRDPEMVFAITNGELFDEVQRCVGVAEALIPGRALRHEPTWLPLKGGLDQVDVLVSVVRGFGLLARNRGPSGISITTPDGNVELLVVDTSSITNA